MVYDRVIFYVLSFGFLSYRVKQILILKNLIHNNKTLCVIHQEHDDINENVKMFVYFILMSGLLLSVFEILDSTFLQVELIEKLLLVLLIFINKIGEVYFKIHVFKTQFTYGIKTIQVNSITQWTVLQSSDEESYIVSIWMKKRHTIIEFKINEHEKNILENLLEDAPQKS